MKKELIELMQKSSFKMSTPLSAACMVTSGIDDDINYLLLCELQKWLRKKHGIGVIVNIDGTLSWIWFISSLHPEASYVGKYIESTNVYSSYELALKAGLTEALKLIVK